MPFEPKSLDTVTDGYYDFIDIYGKPEDWIIREDDNMVVITFENVQSGKKFKLVSEPPTDFDTGDLQKYKDKNMKIRCARVLKRVDQNNEITILYKNIDAIIRFNL